jgi:hypothetical protein
MEMPDPYKKPSAKPTTTYGPPIPSASTVPAPPTTPQSSQQSAQAWINNPDSGQGGMDTYTKVQNDRWNTANQNSDYDTMKKLQSDAQRVGYTLNPYKPPEVKAPNPTAPTQFADWQAKQNELMQKYESMLNTQFQYNAETDPRYQAFQTLSKSRAEAAAKDANKATLETMNDRGLLNSSLTTSQLSQNENKFRQQAETEALAQLPQFYSEARQDYQDRLRNAANMLNFAAGRGDVAYQNEYTRARDERSDKEAARIEEKADREAQIRAEEERRATNIKNANDLAEMFGIGVQPKDSGEALFEQVAGRPTVKAQTEQRQYFQELVNASDKYGEVLPELAQMIGVPVGTPMLNAVKEINDAAYQMGMLGVSQRNAATSEKQANISAQQANTSASRLQFDREQANKPKETKPTQTQQNNEIYAEVLTELDQMQPNERVAFFKGEKSNIVKDLGIDGYNKLYRQYFDEFGDPIQ